jgi:hypothetical protein
MLLVDGRKSGARADRVPAPSRATCARSRCRRLLAPELLELLPQPTDVAAAA